MNYYVKLLSSELESSYNKFWENLSKGDESILAYYHIEYRDVLQACMGSDTSSRYWIVLKEDNNIVAALPCFTKKSDIGLAYCSLPFFGPNAGIICDFTHPDAKIWHELLIKEAIKEAADSNAWSISFYTPLKFSQFTWYEENLGSDVLVVDKFTQHLTIKNPINWDSKIQYDIRKAQKAGLKVVENPSNDHKEQFWNLYLKNCSDYDIPAKPQICLDMILNNMLPKGLAQFFVAIDSGNNNKVIAGILNLISKKTVSYYIPAYDVNYRTHQPMALLIDHAVNDASKKGCSLWNWESSPSRESGVYNYKKRWGSEESTYKIYIKLIKHNDEFQKYKKEVFLSKFPYYYVYPFDLLNNQLK